MNFVEQYYDFKNKWYFKIGTLLFDFYINKEPNQQIEVIKYDYLEDLVYAYINKEIIEETKITKKLKEIDVSALNKLENELLRYVLYISNNYPNTKFNPSDYIYFAMLLEIIILLYNSAFTGISENAVYSILKENLFRFEFIDFKRKQTKVNILIKYLKYIDKNEDEFFVNLRNKNAMISVTSLSNHRNHFVIDIKNKLPELNNYDDELVASVARNYNYNNKLFILNFNLLIEEIVYLLEKEKFTIDKVIFNIDKYKYNREAINYINTYNSAVNKYIMFCSKDNTKLNIINGKYDRCVYVDGDKITNTSEYSGQNILVKKSFWLKNKPESKKYQNLRFITVSDNIIYKFEKEEK